MNWRTSCTSNKHLEKRAPLALLQCSSMTAQWLLPGLSRAAARPVVLCQTHFMSSYQQYFNHRVPCMPGCVTLFCSLPALLVHLGMQTGLIMTGGAVWWFLVLLFVLFLPSFLARWCLDKGKIILCHGIDGECQKRTSYDTRSSLKHTLWSQYVYIKTRSLKIQKKKQRKTRTLSSCAPEERCLTIIYVLGFAVIYRLCFPVDTEQSVEIRPVKSLWKKAETRAGDYLDGRSIPCMWWSLQV